MGRSPLTKLPLKLQSYDHQTGTWMPPTKGFVRILASSSTGLRRLSVRTNSTYAQEPSRLVINCFSASFPSPCSDLDLQGVAIFRVELTRFVSLPCSLFSSLEVTPTMTLRATSDRAFTFSTAADWSFGEQTWETFAIRFSERDGSFLLPPALLRLSLLSPRLRIPT